MKPQTPMAQVQQSGQSDTRTGKAQKPQESKKKRLQVLLRRKRGVSIAVLQKELGWQPHTVRAAISGVRKAGEPVECTSGKTGSVYRIVKPAAAQ